MLRTRVDITDYGPPGPHFGGPWAKTKAFIPDGIGEVPGVGGEVGGGVGGCAEKYGTAFRFGVSLLASGANQVNSSLIINYPFIVEHVQINTDSPLTDSLFIDIRDALDNSTAGGLAASGTSIFGALGVGGGNLKAVSPQVEAFPHFYQPQAYHFLKCVFNNVVSVAARSAEVNISLRLLL